MQYIEPVGAQGPANAFGHDYVDKNAGLGIAGSFLAADMPEHVQLEILNAIVSSGQTPSGADFFQLWKSMQRAAVGQCQLRYVSATQIRLYPKNGQFVRVAGKGVDIPAAGVAAANTGVTVNGVAAQNLAASTTYLVAIGASGALEFWSLATGHGPDATTGNVGVEVITGHADKSLVGMVATNGSAQFAMTSIFAGVISWFNRRSIGLLGTTTPGSNTASIGFVELHSPSRVYFLTWADETVDAQVIGQASNNTTAFSVSAGVGFNGAFGGIAGGSYTASGGQSSYTGSASLPAPSDGLQYVTPLGTVGAGGTGTFSIAALVKIRG